MWDGHIIEKIVLLSQSLPVRGVSLPWADRLMTRSIRVLSTVMVRTGERNPSNINLTSNARKIDSLVFRQAFIKKTCCLMLDQ